MFAEAVRELSAAGTDPGSLESLPGATTDRVPKQTGQFEIVRW